MYLQPFREEDWDRMDGFDKEVARRRLEIRQRWVENGELGEEVRKRVNSEPDRANTAWA